MKKVLLSTALCATMMFAANSDYKYEITPMIGGAYTEGNDLDQDYGTGGLSVGFNLDDSMFNQVEVGLLKTIEDVDYQNSNGDTGITRFFTNLVKEYPLSDSTSLYGLVGAGIEIFDHEEFNNEDGLFGNYGVGIKYKLNDAMALKFDLRHLIEVDHGDNTLLYTLGLSIPFGKKAATAPMAAAPMDSDNDGIIDANDQCPNTPAGAVVDSKGCQFDTDMDGVVNGIDQCPTTPKGDIVDETGCSLKVDLNINFENDSSVINNSYSSKIKKFADFMKAFPTVKAQIDAHTDSVGSEAYNQKLSERRAGSTVKALEAYGIEGSRLNSTGYGETKPKASNDTAAGKAENRRVEGSIKR